MLCFPYEVEEGPGRRTESRCVLLPEALPQSNSSDYNRGVTSSSVCSSPCPVSHRSSPPQDVKHELMKMMEQVGFWSSRSSSRAKSQPASPSKQQVAVLKAVLTAGLYDSVGRILCTPSVDVLEKVVCTVETPQGRAQVHPSSVNRNLQTYGWLLYQEKVWRKGVCCVVSICLVLINRPLQVKYTKIYLRDTTLIPPFPMLLFGGDIDVQHRERLITLDSWIHFQVRGHWSSSGATEVKGRLVLITSIVWSPFQAPVRIGVIFKHLRKLMDSLLEKKLENPKMNLEGE